MNKSQNTQNRLHLIDTLRGVTILSMIAFHACWDLMYFNLGITSEFLFGAGAYIWQQSICWSFILLSGFCFSFGRHHLKRGLLSLGGGVLITVLTCLFMYEERDIFGVLWAIGLSTLIMILIDRLLPKSRACGIIGLLICALLFFFTRGINGGYLGFESLEICKLPHSLYSGYFMTLLGFTDPSFYSSDYFSLIPWAFLYSAGYFLNKSLSKNIFQKKIWTINIRPLSFIGRHSLLIYMLHQPIVFGIIYIINLLR